MNMEQYWRAYDRSLEPPEHPVLAECESCGAEFYEGYDVIKHENDFYCDEKCLSDAVGGYTVTLGEEDY